MCLSLLIFIRGSHMCLLGGKVQLMMLSNSVERHDCLQVLEGKLCLADAVYACRPGFFPPFRSTRYHLNKFPSRFYPKNIKELFNLRHSSLRATVERAFADLNNKFKILYRKPSHTFSTQLKLVLASYILHN
jgi:hypothetical protein